MIINDELKFIFVHVPKTAGQSLHRSFPRPRKNDIPTHTARHEVDRDYFSFGFTRNPWDRMVSLYHFMAQKPVVRDFDQEHLRRIGFKNALFGEYLGDGQRDSFWWLDGCDYIGTFETLQNDYEAICMEIGIDAGIVGKINESVHNDYRKYYTPEMVDFVANKHAKTIERIGYTFE